jgi:glycosyltransferase involved in cell wall biosynthesis
MPDSANRVIKNQCVRVEDTAPEQHIIVAEPPELSVVVPVHNEAGNVAPLITEIVASLSGATSFEIVYVDDGSSDETPTALTGALLSTPTLRVLRHARRSGQSTALRTGVLAARGRWIATLDGDGQNDPADIPALLARAYAVAQERGDDGVLIAGWRTERRDGWYTRWQSRVANAVRSRLLRDGTPDTGCGLKVYARAVFLALPYFDHMHRFMPALVRRAGGEVHSVAVNHRARTRGRSHYGLLNRFWTGLVDMAGVVWLARRARVTDAVELNYEPQVNARHRPPSTTDARSVSAARHSPPPTPTVGEWSTRSGDAA